MTLSHIRCIVVRCALDLLSCNTGTGERTMIQKLGTDKPTSETLKALIGQEMGKGCPPSQPTRGSESAVSSPGAPGRAPAEKKRF